MAKIRGVKPDLWTDEDFVELSPYARLLWIGLWNYACDNGHLQDKSKQIKMRILPTDDVNCAELLREIAAQGLIERSEGWITIPNLSHHQKPHKAWWTTCDMPGCVLPEGCSHAPANRGATVAPPKRNRVATADGDGDGEVEGELKVSGSDTSSAEASASKAASRKRPATPLPQDWKPTEQHHEKRHDGINVDLEADKFRLHAEANDRRQASWNAAFSQWLLNARPAPRVPKARNLQNVHDLERPPDGLSPDEYAAWEYDRRQKRGRA